MRTPIQLGFDAAGHEHLLWAARNLTHTPSTSCPCRPYWVDGDQRGPDFLTHQPTDDELAPATTPTLAPNTGRRRPT